MKASLQHFIVIQLLATLWLLGGTCQFIHAQSASPQQLMYRSYVSGEMAHWRKALEQLSAVNAKSPTFDTLFEEALGRYGYAGYCIEHKQKEDARAHMDAGWPLVEMLAKQWPQSGKTSALQGAYYELEMALSPYQAAWYGWKLVSASRRSMALSPTDAYCLAERALYLWHAPAMAGGDREQALKRYGQAVAAFEKAHQQRHWYYLHTLTLWAGACDTADQSAQANRIYLKIIAHEPHFKRVSEEIYPRFLQNQQTPSSLTR